MSQATPQGIPAPVAFRPARRLPMVRWYDPGQLARTAVEVAVSSIFGRHSDRRLLEALALEPTEPYDFTEDEAGQPLHEIWFDYIADTGDGFNSTYAVAYALSRDALAISGRSLPRGSFLVFGGDEVYPTASKVEYQQRLIAPYRTALSSSTPPHPKVFAIPGNHDWYDSLVTFTRLFSNRDWFAGWQVPQTRSYFALRLPQGWWLLGTDVQLGSDIDKPQVEFFRSVAAHMETGDRVILCNAEPHWIYARMYGQMDENYTENNLAFLEKEILGSRVRIFLAGDLHHYRRHSAPDGRQKITAGGGGAFLHPTHGPDVRVLADGFTHQKSFPDPEESRRLCWRNLAFPALNQTFGLVPAALYALTAWTVMAPVGDVTELSTATYTTLTTALQSPATAFWCLATISGFLLFTDTHSRSYRMIAGTLHGAAHVAASLLLGWAATYFCVTALGWEFHSVLQIVLTLALVFAGGWVVGSAILGVYLLISLNGFGRHQNEAFSSLMCEDYKHLLRFHIDAAGNLTVYPIGIRRVPRNWKETAPGATAGLEPDDARATAPELIEDPVLVRKT